MRIVYLSETQRSFEPIFLASSLQLAIIIQSLFSLQSELPGKNLGKQKHILVSSDGLFYFRVKIGMLIMRQFK